MSTLSYISIILTKRPLRFRRFGPVTRKSYLEKDAISLPDLKGNIAAMGFHQAPGDDQSQPDAAGRIGA